MPQRVVPVPYHVHRHDRLFRHAGTGTRCRQNIGTPIGRVGAARVMMEISPTRTVAIGWQSADLFAFRAARGWRKPLTLLGPGGDRVVGGSGSEVRIILAASPKCGLRSSPKFANEGAAQ